MPLYDRPYMRFQPQPHHRNPLIWMAGAMVALYFVQVFEGLLFKTAYLQDFFILSLDNLMQGRVWTLFTYAFLHGGPLHLLFNLLIIFMVGRIVQTELGDKTLLKLSAACAFGGAALFQLLHFGQSIPLLGASAIAVGLLTIFCLLHPDEPMTFLLFFILPVTVKPRYLLMGMLLVELVFLPMEFTSAGSVASSAHLGGMAAAAIYFQKGLRRAGFLPKGSNLRVVRKRNRVKTPAAVSSSQQSYRVNITNRSDLRSEVDRILDKINSQGFGSLTDEEKSMLDRARDILSK